MKYRIVSAVFVLVVFLSLYVVYADLLGVLVLSDNDVRFRIPIRLDDLVGSRLVVYNVGEHDVRVVVDKVICFIGLDGSHNFQHMGSVRASGFLVDVYRSGDVRIYVSSRGFVRVVVGDGKSLPFLSYRVIDKNASLLRGFLEDLMGVRDLHVVYGGVGGEKSVTEIVETVYPNGTHISSGPVVRVVNPFDKYYVVLDGLRIGYPVKIRGVDRDRVGGGAPRIQYFELLAPRITSKYSFVVTKNMVEEIKKYFDSAFKTSVNVSRLVIIDAYLLLSDDKNKLLPTLKIQEIGTGNVLWVQLDTNKTIFISATTYASSGVGPDEPAINIPSTITSGANKLNSNILVTALIVAGISVIALIGLTRIKNLIINK
ncbi:MAG: hypothetical protein GXO43_05600 [Crenarchaeota archaeon]|nr:hypothetical protein [Thermoproteota archaeon]